MYYAVKGTHYRKQLTLLLELQFSRQKSVLEFYLSLYASLYNWSSL